MSEIELQMTKIKAKRRQMKEILEINLKKKILNLI